MFPRSDVQSQVFSALRVSAICDRNHWLFLAILLLSLPPVVTNAVRSTISSVRACIKLILITW